MTVQYYKDFATELPKLTPEERLSAMQGYLRTIEDSELRLEAARYLVSFPGGIDDAPETVFVLLHGIRTGGAWQDRLAQMLRVEHQVTAFPVKYGIFNVMKFLIPSLRKSAYRLAERHLLNVREIHPNARIVLVAHSFGTHIVAHLLTEKRCLIDRLLLCGSVIDQKFDWKTAFPPANRFNVINDVGTKDMLPVVAHATSFGCGASGFLGFGNPCVTDRFHPLSHSEFFSDSHIRKYWLPFLTEGRVVPSEHTEERLEIGWLPGFVCSLPNSFATIGALIVLVASIAFSTVW